ncbi:hypothetical protein vseg_014755 [Gypsophila vaccaria]
MVYVKFSLLMFLFFVLFLSSHKLETKALVISTDHRSDSIVVPKSDIGYNEIVVGSSIHKEKVATKSRKVLEELVQPDYDYAGPNPKHDPRKGRGGRSL